MDLLSTSRLGSVNLVLVTAPALLVVVSFDAILYFAQHFDMVIGTDVDAQLVM